MAGSLPEGLTDVMRQSIILPFAEHIPHSRGFSGRERVYTMAEKKILTRSGYEKLENELNDLTVNQRKEIAQKIKEAREQGDLSENAEYDAAKEEQRNIEARIAELETILKNVEIVEEVGIENAFIFGLSANEVMKYEREGGYNPMDIFNGNQNVRRVLTQLINGTYCDDTEKFRDLYDSLIKEDVYFILKDFDSYAEAHRRVDAAYRDEAGWARMAMLNTACSGKFSSDRTIEEYVKDIWKLKKMQVEIEAPAAKGKKK